ncbi:hypothetical protein H0H93_015340 [Arthromyces matolae]|nr:hypothetical protein H0H93_015340 [Arthromyces matolae]
MPKSEDIIPVDEASVILKDVTEKVEAIKNDESIPLRSNKKTGAKSKKEVREQAQAEATEKLKNIAVKHGYVSGKWSMIKTMKRPSTNSNVALAESLVSGPLASTCAYMAKVATSTELSQDSSNYQHLIYIYIPDVYDKVNVSETLLNAKTENKAPSEEQPPKATTKSDLDDASVSKPKPKPKLKKKAADDPFASDDDKEDDSNAQTKKRPVSDRSANEDESDSGERPKKKKPTRARK